MPAQTAKPVEAMKDYGRMQKLERLLRAASYYLSSYRDAPNLPLLQGRKEALWAELEETLAELREAIDGQA